MGHIYEVRIIVDSDKDETPQRVGQLVTRVLESGMIDRGESYEDDELIDGRKLMRLGTTVVKCGYVP